MYDHRRIEKKWQGVWKTKAIYSPNLHKATKPYYNLMMFPYPSAEGLHVGNMYAFTGADVFGRFNRMKGFDVFEPIGLDGFGIHSENYAIKIGRHPKKHAQISERKFYNQLLEIGNGFAWDRRLETYDADYYRWTQWLFIQMFNNKLAYRGTAWVNWCPSCKTVLADEQAEKGECERCGAGVERKKMESWYFKITQYGEKLLQNLEKIDWPEKIKIAQRQWIGKKQGIDISYKIKGTKAVVTCFTTRPDTNFGATFVVLSPELAREMLELFPEIQRSKVSQYIKDALSKTEQQRLAEEKTKTGVFTGLYAINQLNNYEMPIWVGDFVLASVGTGAVVGVPGHDKRDFEFAQAHKLPIIRVVIGSDGERSKISRIDQVQDEEGKMINSGFLNGLDIHQATKKMMIFLEKNGWGKRIVNYHLRDWLISRQRYWGPPIPMINCLNCGWQPVLEKNLPVLLPDVKDFKPKGDGTSPLDNAPDSWKITECPKCGAKAQRELNVSDTFLDSAWYFLAYPSLGTKEWRSKKSPFNKELTQRWLPVNAYIGGAEHAVLHLLYARFVTMALHDMGYLDFEEPFPFLFGHGLIIKDGAKMSKSKGNVVVPDNYIKKFGADTLRAYLMFMGPYDQGGDFRDTGIEGMYRFLLRVWDLFISFEKVNLTKESEKEIIIKMHQTIKKVTEDMAKFRFNTALASIMEYVNLLRDKLQNSEGQERKSQEWNQALKVLAQLLAPFAPHMTEEAWVSVFSQEFSIHTSKWPKFNLKLIKVEKAVIVLQINGKVRSQVTVSVGQAKRKMEIMALAQKDPKIQKWLRNRQIKKSIFIPGKLLNFVTR